MRSAFEPAFLTPRQPEREAAAAALSLAYGAAYSNAPDYVVHVPCSIAGAYAVGLVPLFHNDAAGLERSPADTAAERAAPAHLVDDVRHQLESQRVAPPRALPLDRAVPPEAALWAGVWEAVERELGLPLADMCQIEAFYPHFTPANRAIPEKIEAELPATWFAHRDLFSIDHLVDTRLIHVLITLGVPGLRAWSPFIAAARVVDHFWMRSGYLVICDPPVRCALDESGEAYEWCDGWGAALSHGD